MCNPATRLAAKLGASPSCLEIRCAASIATPRLRRFHRPRRLARSGSETGRGRSRALEQAILVFVAAAHPRQRPAARCRGWPCAATRLRRARRLLLGARALPRGLLTRTRSGLTALLCRCRLARVGSLLASLLPPARWLLIGVSHVGSPAKMKTRTGHVHGPPISCARPVRKRARGILTLLLWLYCSVPDACRDQPPVKPKAG